MMQFVFNYELNRFPAAASVPVGAEIGLYLCPMSVKFRF